MKIAVVFGADPELGPDPLDEHKMPRKLGEFIGDNDDCLLVWREYGEQFEDGYRTHLVSQGVWENVDVDRFAAAVEYISGLPADD